MHLTQLHPTSLFWAIALLDDEVLEPMRPDASHLRDAEQCTLGLNCLGARMGVRPGQSDKELKDGVAVSYSCEDMLDFSSLKANHTSDPK
ncbi:hypothetical protein GJAV_G00188080 [Gymnothorax javanicus]|nr:hypothetical protein GJAV_G00188080 [Gymnothorax javanicus]